MRDVVGSFEKVVPNRARYAHFSLGWRGGNPLTGYMLFSDRDTEGSHCCVELSLPFAIQEL